MKKYDMAVKTGTYTTQAGEKNRYENVGEVHSSERGGFYARVNPFRMMGVAMAAIARGDDSMMISLFEPNQQGQQGQQGKAAATAQSNSTPADFEDDIPF